MASAIAVPAATRPTDSYARALREDEEVLAREDQEQAALTSESHPYTVSSSGKVHVWNCRSQPRELRVQHPGRTL